MQRPWGKEGLAGVEFCLIPNWKWSCLKQENAGVGEGGRAHVAGSEKVPSVLTRAYTEGYQPGGAEAHPSRFPKEQASCPPKPSGKAEGF